MGNIEIQYIAKSPWLKNISSMCHGKGLPKEADVKAFLKLPCLREGWQGNDEAVQDKPLDRALVTNISSMYSSKGLPKEANVKAFVQWLPSDEKKNFLKLACKYLQVLACLNMRKSFAIALKKN